MRTTVSIQDALLRMAQRLAERSGKTLSQVIEDALRAELVRGNESRKVIASG